MDKAYYIDNMTKIWRIKGLAVESLKTYIGCLNVYLDHFNRPPQTITREQRCSSISFIVDMNGQRLPFRLPANVEKVKKWLRKKKPNGTDKTIAEQSERIAWKQQYEILHLQLGQIEMEQLEKLEVFFPYLYDINRNETYYQKLKSNGFAGLISNG